MHGPSIHHLTRQSRQEKGNVFDGFADGKCDGVVPTPVERGASLLTWRLLYDFCLSTLPCEQGAHARAVRVPCVLILACRYYYMYSPLPRPRPCWRPMLASIVVRVASHTTVVTPRTLQKPRVIPPSRRRIAMPAITLALLRDSTVQYWDGDSNHHLHPTSHAPR